MTTTLTGAQVLASVQALNTLSSQSMPVQGAIAVRNAHRALLPLVSAAHERSAHADNTESVIQEFFAETFSPGIRTIPAGLLGAAQVTPAQMEALGWLFADISPVP